MDRRPPLEARPPALIDRVVRALVPVACREHVIGDLWERYRSPTTFVVDALRTIPYVIASQVRRTSTFGGVVIQTFILTVAFMVGGGLRRAVPPVAAGLVALVLRDAYKRRVSVSAKQVAADVSVGLAAAIICESVLAFVWPALLLPWPSMITGRGMIAFPLGFVMLFLLRLQNPGLGAHPRRFVSDAPLALDALTTEVRTFEGTSRRAMRIEAVTGLTLAVLLVVPLFFSPNWFMRIGWALASAYGLYVAAVVTSQIAKPMPHGLDFDATTVFYRRELERRASSLETMWRWYFLPGAPGMVFIMIGGALAAAERGRPMWPALTVMIASVALVATVGHAGTRKTARKLRLRIDTLSRGRNDGPGEP